MRKGIIALTAVLGGCTSLLGDFTVGDGGGSPDVTTDVGIDTGVDSAPDVAKDSPIDTGPTCGNISQQCCNGTCNQGACCANNCLDVSKDSQNCGVCGHTCYGEQCLNGMCQPEKLTQVGDTRPGRVRLDQKNAYFISVYSSSGASLYSCDLQGCTSPTTLLKNMAFAYDMVIDDSFTNVYVADYNAATLYYCFTSGCSLVPGIVSVAAPGSVAGLAYRSGELYAILGVQPHEFKVDGSQDVSLGNGNEGANYITAPRGSTYVYWQNGSHSVRVAKDNVAQSYGDFWTSTSAESVLQVEGDGSYVAWVAEGSSSTSIYTCALGTSCAGNNTIASGNVGYEAGALTVDGAANTVYWTGVDTGASHVYVKTCSATTSCTSPITVASITTKAGAAVAGGVAVNNSYVYFTLEDAGTIYLYRVAK